MQKISNPIVREWFLSAQDDELLIEQALKENKNYPPNPLCFLAQQIAEKSLKGFLVFLKQEVPKLHQIEKLLDMCAQADANFLKFQEAGKWLSEFYVATRYPADGNYKIFSHLEAKEAFEKAISIKSFVMDKIFQNKNMNCPNCENEKLKEIVFNNVAVGHCPKCLGLWFEQDELRQAKDERDKDLNWLDIDLWADERKFQLGRGRKVCPKDGVPLYEVSYGDSDISLDVCGQCRGIWLDRGEFKKILDYLKNKGQDEALNNYFANFVKEGLDVFTGPETLREEFSDFVSLLKVLNYKFMVQYPYLAKIIMSLPK